MLVYRICRDSYSADMSGTGARLFGGRWNRKGMPVVYTSTSRALASLEYLVHTGINSIPDDAVIISISVPDEDIFRIDTSRLPANWRNYPSPAELCTYTDEWLSSDRSFICEVPSSLIVEESNIILNPEHPAMAAVSVRDRRNLDLVHRFK